MIQCSDDSMIQSKKSPFEHRIRPTHIRDGDGDVTANVEDDVFAVLEIGDLLLG